MLPPKQIPVSTKRSQFNGLKQQHRNARREFDQRLLGEARAPTAKERRFWNVLVHASVEKIAHIEYQISKL